MQIVMGRGNRRQVFEIPHVSLLTKETRERLSWNLKSMLFERGVISNLG